MDNTYILVTAAKNEEDYIEKTIRSVISQTITPRKWVIVSDGSNDETEKIVSQYSSKHNFIQLLSIQGDLKRSTASKVYAINKGLKTIESIDYQFIGNVDADIEFGSNYFENLLEKFNNDIRLGIAGGWIHELQNGKFIERFGNSKRNVPGSIQMFRRKCFEMIGGYIPLNRGGEDATAEVMARMYGWTTESFPEFKVFHHRTTNIDKCNILCARYNQGKEDYFLGYHPLFEFLKCLRRIRGKPFIISSIFRLFGYIGGLLSKESSNVPQDVVQYLRREQIMRIRSLFKLKRFIS